MLRTRAPVNSMHGPSFLRLHECPILRHRHARRRKRTTAPPSPLPALGALLSAISSHAGQSSALRLSDATPLQSCRTPISVHTRPPPPSRSHPHRPARERTRTFRRRKASLPFWCVANCSDPSYCLSSCRYLSFRYSILGIIGACVSPSRPTTQVYGNNRLQNRVETLQTSHTDWGLNSRHRAPEGQ